jgi:hypothetical protein
VEEIRVAFGTVLGNPDVIKVETRFQELTLVGLGKVDTGLAFSAEVGGDLGADFKATKSDTRANGRAE